MTPEQFDDLVRHSPSKEFVAAVNALDEKNRKAFLKIVKLVRKDTHDAIESFHSVGLIVNIKKLQKTLEKWRIENPDVQSNIALGLLACGAASDAHRVELWELERPSGDLVASVLIARKPVWLDTWVKKRLGGEFPDVSWEIVRSLYKAGVIEMPKSEGYITLFIEAMRGYNYDDLESYIPTSERLKAEPEFLDDEVWKIFEFENDALTTDWNASYNNAPKNYEIWPAAIIRLANDGYLDRDRLLDITLTSMLMEMKQNQLSAFGRLHEALTPNADEIKDRQQAYLDLLVSPVGPVLSFAVKMLGKLNRSGKLDSALFLDGVPPVFSHKAKGTAMQVMKIADKLDCDDRALGPKISAVCVAAMSHASPDVQAFALGVLERYFAITDDASRNEFERHIPFLAAKLQSRASALVGLESENGNDSTSENDLHARVDEIEALPADLRRLLGIQGGVAEAMPEPLRYNILDLPCVVNRESLKPVATRDELLELAARLIEGVDSADEVEVLIDGIARFGSDRGGNFGKLSAPLVQRVETGATSRDGLSAGGGPIAIALVDLLLSWWTGLQYESRRTPHYSESPQEAFAAARIREIQAMLSRGGIGRLLSMPTHKGGWIDPKVFVQRLFDCEEGKRKVLEHDLMQAMLRLGPGNRRDALQAASKLQGDVGNLARFALGGNEGPKRQDKAKAHVWLCAARARKPEGPLQDLLSSIANKIPDLPGLLGSTDWNWSVKVEENQGYRRAKIDFDDDLVTNIDMGNIYGRDLLKEAKRKLTGPTWHKWPTAGLRTWPTPSLYAMYQFGSPWKIEWRGMQYPLDTECHMHSAVRMLDLRIDENTSRDTPVHAFLTALFDATRPWGNITNLGVCIGLLSRSSDARGYAIDALIPAIESGHADFRKFASTFVSLIGEGAYKINRFGTAMASILDVSDLHKWWVGSLVDQIVGQLDTMPKGAHHLYEVALECMSQLNVRPSATMAARLKEHKGSSKIAKLAKELLACDGSPIHVPGKPVVSAAWLGRLQLANGLLKF